MKILIVSATDLEIDPLSEYLNKLPSSGLYSYALGHKTIQTLVTGVGGIKTAYSMATFPQIKDFNILINVGLAGIYHSKFKLGQVVEVTSDQFGDIGVEEKDGQFLSVFDIGLDKGNQFPFNNGIIQNSDAKFKTQLQTATSVSYNMVSGSASTIAIRSKLLVDIETMEGAAFAYASKYLQIPYLQIRGISNYVEPRDKTRWQIQTAVERLNEEIIRLIEGF
jgi:futalosine hydrolase